MVAAVVFDMDGVIADTEHVWDEVREALVSDWGGTYSAAAQRAMMGMSSVEWSRYMHDELGLKQAPEEINAEVVHRMLASLPFVSAARGRSRGDRPHVIEVGAARRRVLLEPAADRRSSRSSRHRSMFRGHRLLGGGRPGQAEPGRLPRGGATPWHRAGAVRRRRGLRERHPRRARGGNAGDRLPEQALSS